VRQLLETKPEGAVDLLETTLLVKKTAFAPQATPVVKPTCQHPKDTAAAVSITELYKYDTSPSDNTERMKSSQDILPHGCYR
jgi:hypothetical protein